MNVVLNCEQAVWAAHACQLKADHLDRMINRIPGQLEITRDMKRDRDQYREIYQQLHDRIEHAIDADLETRTEMEQ